MSTLDNSYDDLYSLDDDGDIQHHRSGEFSSEKPNTRLAETVEVLSDHSRAIAKARQTSSAPPPQKGPAHLKHMKSTPVFPSVSEILEGYDAVKKKPSLDVQRKRGPPPPVPSRSKKPSVRSKTTKAVRIDTADHEAEVLCQPNVISPAELPSLASAPPPNSSRSLPRVPARPTGSTGHSDTPSIPTSPTRDADVVTSVSDEIPQQLNRRSRTQQSQSLRRAYKPSLLRHSRSLGDLGTAFHSQVSYARPDYNGTSEIRFPEAPARPSNESRIHHRPPHGLMVPDDDATLVPSTQKATPKPKLTKNRLRRFATRWFAKKKPKPSELEAEVPPANALSNEMITANNCEAWMRSATPHETARAEQPQQQITLPPTCTCGAAVSQPPLPTMEVWRRAGTSREDPTREHCIALSPARPVTTFKATHIVEYYSPGGQNRFESRVPVRLYA